MQTDLYVTAIIKAKDGSADELRDLLIPATVEFRKEAGCLHYALHEDIETPGCFVTYEIWRDQAALDAHMKAPTLAALAPKLGPLLDGEVKQLLLKTLLKL